jgi:hypothetical protein
LRTPLANRATAVAHSSTSLRSTPIQPTPVRQAIDDHRRWKRNLLRDQLTAAGNADPERNADILTVAGDGLVAASHLDNPADLRGLIHQTVDRVSRA